MRRGRKGPEKEGGGNEDDGAAEVQLSKAPSSEKCLLRRKGRAGWQYIIWNCGRGSKFIYFIRISGDELSQ